METATPRPEARRVKLHGVANHTDTVPNGAKWSEAKIDYPGTKLSWALWSFDWRPTAPGDYVLTARATDDKGGLQAFDPARLIKSGATGFHKIVVHLYAS